jgi:hypothetical protein
MSDFEETFKNVNIADFVSDVIANFWQKKKEREKEYQKYQEYKKYQEKLNYQKNYHSPVVMYVVSTEESSVSIENET